MTLDDLARGIEAEDLDALNDALKVLPELFAVAQANARRRDQHALETVALASLPGRGPCRCDHCTTANALDTKLAEMDE